MARSEGMRKARVGFNIHKLQSEDIGRYNVEVKNKFDALGDIKTQKENTIRFWRCIEMLQRK